MTITELQERVAKAQEKVEKAKGTIARHEKQLEKKVKATFGAPTPSQQYDIEWKEQDIKEANKKLQSAEEVLANWKAKLEIEIEKERFLNDNAPEVIKEFLENWKKLAFGWHTKRYTDYKELQKRLKVEQRLAQIVYVESNPEEFARILKEDGKVDEDKLRWVTTIQNKGMEKFLKERGLDWSSIKAREMNFAGHTILKMDDFYDEADRLAWLEKELEADKKAKMLDLINRVNEKVGSITDADGLRIDPKGNLNGIIVGEKGSAKVETIGAGGYNIQCFHFRTLVHKL